MRPRLGAAGSARSVPPARRLRLHHRFVDEELQQVFQPPPLRPLGLIAEDVPLAHGKAEQQGAARLRLPLAQAAVAEQLREVVHAFAVAFGEHRSHAGVAASPGAHRHLHAGQRIGRRHIDGDLGEQVQLFHRVLRLGLHVTDDVPGGVVAPVVDDRRQQILPVLEVPVEAALADVQRTGERLDRHRIHALVDEHVQRRLHPVLTVQSLARFQPDVHTPPY
ncbi:hypothetical protein LRS04_15735 [Phenylobacterium sp. J367]|nr:hypothetical protein [Phenylobacterium sp. J367]MCR5879618.1 hypothetical protein [Phenylobacterium sp. J367]